MRHNNLPDKVVNCGKVDVEISSAEPRERANQAAADYSTSA